MRRYRDRIAEAAGRASPLIVALDYPARSPRPAEAAARTVGAVRGTACAVKVNYHLLLRLGPKEVAGLCAAARRGGMLCIADIKLNDIGSTNDAAASALWSMGFDAVIANPIMGRVALERLAGSARARGRGVIALCHMSAPEARESYELAVRAGKGRPHEPLYQRFLRWADEAGADGAVVGATFPGIIRECARLGPSLPVYSPGVGAQGADASETARAGASYVIVGRTIQRSRDQGAAAGRIAAQLGPRARGSAGAGAARSAAGGPRR